MRLGNFLYLSICLLVAFFISSSAFVVDDSFLILRNAGEIGAGFLCAAIFSSLCVFPFFGVVKMISRKQAWSIRLVNTVYTLLAGVLLAPLPVAAQEYLFIRKALRSTVENVSGITMQGEEQTDCEEFRWWPYGGYTLRGIKAPHHPWRFIVMD